MSTQEPRSLLDKFVGLCVSFLAGAIALYVAVQLIRSVAWVLAIIGSLVVIGSLVAMWFRNRRRGW